jgi:hypothetical protein
LDIRRYFFPKALLWHLKGPTGVKRAEQNKTARSQEGAKPIQRKLEKTREN